MLWARAALDHIAWDLYTDLVDHEDPRKADRLYFPVRATRGDFDGTMKATFPGATPEVVDIFLSIQDHQTGKNLLEPLNKLSTDLRHRALGVAAYPDLKAEFVMPDVPEHLSLDLGIPQTRTLTTREPSVACLIGWRTVEGIEVARDAAPPVPALPELNIGLGVSGLRGALSLESLSECLDRFSMFVLRYRLATGR
ncbi:hypothetical protein C5B97_11725 [Pseudoclavibacter sp. RFBB5]|nr:hypothetical protein C5B97_11725 [Pseudoclavibacter sp. RFBB5]